MFSSLYLFFSDFIYLFVEKEEGREKEKERNSDWLRLACTPTGDGTHDPDTCPERELNW